MIGEVAYVYREGRGRSQPYILDFTCEETGPHFIMGLQAQEAEQ